MNDIALLNWEKCFESFHLQSSHRIIQKIFETNSGFHVK